MDANRLTQWTCMWAPEVRVDRATGEIRTDRATGQPTYSVGVSCRYAGEREADVLDIQVVGEPVGLVEGQPVRVFDLEMRPYEVEGRSGYTFRASAITAAGADAPPKPEPATATVAAARGAGRGAAA